MKKFLSLTLAVIILFTGLFAAPPAAHAAKATTSKAIAIVFDNSRSMYIQGNQAWCRATYAMEVFASMLNPGDTLQIYPMHTIQVDGREYTMDNPFTIRNSAQASSIRNILTVNAGGTPIESIDCAVEGLGKLSADQKYMIVLTDGDTFYKNGRDLGKSRTVTELDARIQANAGNGMSVMFLGIGKQAQMPKTPDSDVFVKRKASDSADVLSTLTEMCNTIFGRDTLPKKFISGNQMTFDISMSKTIVFVQGQNISGLNLLTKDGQSAGTPTGVQQTMYSTQGATNEESIPDKSLQGMMVTYENLPSGTYTIDYQGTATSIEVYYEPDADLDFVFTDSNGNNVDLNSLYEGEYKVSFGMKDARTGQLISSELLGSPHYEGSYYINGEETTFSYDGYSGEVPITLNMNDTFGADLTVTYLSGYTITKNSTDFGWPEGGVRVVAPPLGKFRVKLEVPEDYILIKELYKAPEITAYVTFSDEKLTDKEFEAVTLNVDCGGIAYDVTPDVANSCYKIQFKDTPGIKDGKYEIKVEAQYLDVAERAAKADDDAKITLSDIPLWMKWAIGLGISLLIFIILWIILHIRVLPTQVNTTRRLSTHNFDGEDVTNATTFTAEVKGRSGKAQAKFGGKKFGVAMSVSPGKESYLYKSQKKRSAEVKPDSIRTFGPAKIQDVLIGSAKYIRDEDTGKLVPAIPNQKPFNLTNGMMIKYSGTLNDAGIDKDFEVTSKLNFKKK